MTLAWRFDVRNDQKCRAKRCLHIRYDQTLPISDCASSQQGENDGMIPGNESITKPGFYISPQSTGGIQV